MSDAASFVIVREGDQFFDPDGRLYCTATHDQCLGNTVRRSAFRFEGETPKPNAQMPEWLVRQLEARASELSGRKVVIV